ncbi:MAG: cell division protein FtsA [Oligoflexia bacterium]|nr:cell division protein FtsA [Oligoflexia bacterium]
MNERPKNIVVCIDVGTTKTCTIIAELKTLSKNGGVDSKAYIEENNKESQRILENKINILGVGQVPSFGLKKGLVVNIDKTISSIKSSLLEAQKTAQIDAIKNDFKTYISIAGPHIHCFNHRLSMALKGVEVSSKDVEKLLDMANFIEMPADRKIIQVVPQEYFVDEVAEIRNPVGMNGKILEVDLHVVTGSINAISNLTKCVERSQIKVDEIVLQPMASSEAVLREEDKEAGVLLVDIGGGTTDVALWSNGVLLQSEIVAIGGNHFSNDLSVALNTSLIEAEKIKINYGHVITERVNSKAHISIQGLNGTRPREVPLTYVSEILSSRAMELLSIIKKLLFANKKKMEGISGVVLTGGGAKIRGLAILAEAIIGVPTKVGYPPYVLNNQGLQYPEYSTGLGLVIWAQRKYEEDFSQFEINKQSFIYRINESLRNAFKELF